jgi:hypothetical protein
MIELPRLLTETNITPVDVQPPQRNGLLSAGFAQCTILYNGTLNRTGVWCSDDFILQSTLDFSREAGQPGMPADRSMPPDAFSLHACGLLCNTPAHYIPGVPSKLPVIFNLETGIWDDRSTVAKLKTLWQDLADSANGIKTYSPNTTVGVFFWPVFDQAWDPTLNSSAEFIAFSAAIDFVTPEFYTHPENGQDLAAVQTDWLAAASTWNKNFDQFFPGKTKLAFLNPFYAVNGDQGATWNALQNTPVDLALWTFQCQWAIRSGYSILCWATNVSDPVPTTHVAALTAAVAQASIMSHLSLPDPPTSTEFVYSDSGLLGTTTTLDVRIKCSLDHWTAAGVQRLCGKRTGDACWGMYLLDSSLYFIYFLVGGSNNQQAIPIAYADGATKWLRAIVDVTNVKYIVYDSDDGVNWNVLADIPVGFAANLNDATGAITVGQESTGFPNPMQGKVWYFDVRNSIDGPIVASTDFTNLQPGTRTFEDPQGNTWNLFGDAVIELDPRVGGQTVLGASPVSGLLDLLQLPPL